MIKMIHISIYTSNKLNVTTTMLANATIAAAPRDNALDSSTGTA